MEFIDWMGIFLAIFVVGEAIALLLGMIVFGDGDNPWISLTNITSLAIDIISGFLLMISILPEFLWVGSTRLLSTVLLVILLSHLHRVYDYFYSSGEVFLANRPLFYVNLIKLIWTVVLLIMYSLFS